MRNYNQLSVVIQRFLHRTNALTRPSLPCPTDSQHHPYNALLLLHPYWPRPCFSWIFIFAQHNLFFFLTKQQRTARDRGAPFNRAYDRISKIKHVQSSTRKKLRGHTHVADCWLLGPADARAPRGSYLHARPRPAPLGRFHTIYNFFFFRIEDFWPGRGPKIHFLSEVNLQEIAAARQMYQARREKKVVFIRTKFSGKSVCDAKPSWTNYAVRSNYRVASCKDKFS